jgi:hypothetical protein
MEKMAVTSYLSGRSLLAGQAFSKKLLFEAGLSIPISKRLDHQQAQWGSFPGKAGRHVGNRKWYINWNGVLYQSEAVESSLKFNES